MTGADGPLEAGSFAAIDWRTWQPRETATLVFVVQAGRILLIRKKRGLGKGKITGPGGRLEEGESPAQCAVREAREEVGITPVGLREAGELNFQFTDGYGLRVHVFTAQGCRGQARESDEAVPLWCSLAEIPYEEMWADDYLWIPLLLAGRWFKGNFLFEGDLMRGYQLEAGLPVPP